MTPPCLLVFPACVPPVSKQYKEILYKRRKRDVQRLRLWYYIQHHPWLSVLIALFLLTATVNVQDITRGHLRGEWKPLRNEDIVLCSALCATIQNVEKGDNLNITERSMVMESGLHICITDDSVAIVMYQQSMDELPRIGPEGRWE